MGPSESDGSFEGPDDNLRLTENAQPALMVSVAIIRVMQEEQHPLTDVASYVAGHSLGGTPR